MRLKTAVVVFKTDRSVSEDSSKLRGYIGGLYPDEILLHHHVGKENIYTYPRIQYKIIEGTPIVVGVEEGAKILKRIADEIEELKLGRRKYRVISVHLSLSEQYLGDSREFKNYKILLPWLALNQENFKKYKELKDWKEKKNFLNSILVANIISMCKGLGYTVRYRLRVSSFLEETRVKFKSVYMVGFLGKFRINFAIPDYLGIGKGVSHGFGTLKSSMKESRGSL